MPGLPTVSSLTPTQGRPRATFSHRTWLGGAGVFPAKVRSAELPPLGHWDLSQEAALVPFAHIWHAPCPEGSSLSSRPALGIPQAKQAL